VHRSGAAGTEFSSVCEVRIIASRKAEVSSRHDLRAVRSMRVTRNLDLDGNDEDNWDVRLPRIFYDRLPVRQVKPRLEDAQR